MAPKGQQSKAESKAGAGAPFFIRFLKDVILAYAAVLGTRLLMLGSGFFGLTGGGAGEVLGLAALLVSALVHVFVIGDLILHLSRAQFEKRGSFKESMAIGAAFAFLVGIGYGYVFFELGSPQAEAFNLSPAFSNALLFLIAGAAVAFFSCAIETDHWQSDAGRFVNDYKKTMIALITIAVIGYAALLFLASQTITWSTPQDCDSTGLYENLVMAARTNDWQAKKEVFGTPSRDLCYLLFSGQRGSRALCEKISTPDLRTRCLTSYVLSGQARLDNDVCSELPGLASCEAFVKADPALCGADGECRREVLLSTGDYKACDLAVRENEYFAAYQQKQLSFTAREWCVLSLARKNLDPGGCTFLDQQKAAYCMYLINSAPKGQCKPYPYCERP